MPTDVIDRVKGVMAHAHEPGLRQRLKHYFALFEQELKILRPNFHQKTYISRSVATRNHFAHRTDHNDHVFEGIDLWDATETMKALSQLALLSKIGAEIEGIGQKMLDTRFVNYSIEK